ncbi:MAG: hypothetical protein Q4F71_10280 [Paracoccus sp. (in: a-proteobacteria)]|nr:hypothetical protein [Paracoccus sp. (in: a-proteobacteria)]
MSEFETIGLQGGIWSGLLSREVPPAAIHLVHAAEIVGTAQITAEGGAYRIDAAIPAARLSDGMQTFLLVEQQGEASDARADSGAPVMARLHILAGRPLDQDMKAEIELLRAELDLLKREFRRLARG